MRARIHIDYQEGPLTSSPLIPLRGLIVFEGSYPTRANSASNSAFNWGFMSSETATDCSLHKRADVRYTAVLDLLYSNTWRMVA